MHGTEVTASFALISMPLLGDVNLPEVISLNSSGGPECMIVQ